MSVVPVDVRELPKGTLVDQFLHEPGCRDEPIGKGHEGDHAPPCSFGRHRLGFGHAHRQGLFAADVHACLEGGHDRIVVRHVRGPDRDGVDGVVTQECPVVRSGHRSVCKGRGLRGRWRVRIGTPCKVDASVRKHLRNMDCLDDPACPDHTDTYSFHGDILPISCPDTAVRAVAFEGTPARIHAGIVETEVGREPATCGAVVPRQLVFVQVLGGCTDGVCT